MRYVKEGYDINLYDCNCRTPLQEAILHKHEDIAILLSDCKNLLIDQYSAQGFTALHYATAEEEYSVVERLLMKGANVNLKAYSLPLASQYSGLTALHIACMLGNIKLVDLLLRHGADLAVKDRAGRTPLHYAVAYASNDSQHQQVAELLLLKNRKILDMVDADGASPLVMAIVSLEKDNLNIVKFLLGESADLSSKTYMLLSHGKGVAPLIAAITQNRVDIVSLFLKLNCDINTLDLNKHTALDYAVYYYANDVQKLLLSYNGTCTLSKQDQLRFAAYPVAYPLHEAACEGNLERVRLLIEKDCVDVNEQDQCECTPLHYACMNGHGHIVSYLINDRKAMTCILDKWNKTAFYYAVAMKHAAIVEYMLRDNPDLVRGDCGSECIECAGRNRDCATALALLAAGAKLENPLHWAVVHDLKDVVIHLVNSPHYVNQQDGEGKLPIHKAIEKNSYFYTDLLIRVGSKLTVADRYQNTVLSYCKDIPKLRELMRTLTDVDSIVQKHSVRCDVYEKPLDFDATVLKSFYIPGAVESSLTQVVPDDKVNFYGVYYALFSAVCATNSVVSYTREHFVGFFKKALSCIKDAGGNPPYDNLSGKQIRYILKQLYSGQNLPVVVLENDRINAYLKGLIQDPQNIFDVCEGDKDLSVVQEFIEGKLDKIALIIRTEGILGRWITVYAHRTTTSMMSFKIFDSYGQDAWRNNFLKECLSFNIILLYALLANPIDQWKYVINKEFSADMQKLINLQALMEKVFKEELVNLGTLFDDFIQSIYELRQYIGVLGSYSNQRILCPHISCIHYNIRLQNFILFKKYLLRALDNEIIKRNPCDACNKDVLDYCCKLYASDYQKFIEELADKCTNAIPECAVLWQTNLQRTIDATMELKGKLSVKAGSDLSGSFYDVAVMPLSDDMLAFMRRYVQFNIQNLIHELNEGQQGSKTVLFYGPPGNGKTTIAQAIAQWCPCKNHEGVLVARPFRIIRVPALGTPYQFSKQQQIAALKNFISENPSAVILLDEVDALSDFYHDQDNATEVMQELFDFAMHTQVVFIATTNSDIYATDEKESNLVKKNKHIGDALVSRFQKIEKIDNPACDHRRAIIINCVRVWQEKECGGKKIIIDLSDNDITSLAKKTDKFSIRDLETLFKLAYQYSFVEQPEASPVICRCIITRASFDKALLEIKKGKCVNYWSTLYAGLKNFVSYGSPWVSFLYSLYINHTYKAH